MFFDLIYRFFFSYPSISFGRASREDIKSVLKKEGLDEKDIFLTDSEYKLPRKADILLLFAKNAGRFVQYRKESYDCDDFARTASATLHLLYGNIAVGDAAIRRGSGNHMLNIVVTSNLEVVYVEPQNNSITGKEKPYFVII